MKIISKSLLWSSAFSLVLPQTAFLSSAYASLVDTSQNQAFESKPAQFLKLAAVHFITNDGGLKFGGSNPGGQEFNPGDLCKSRGYLHKGCPAGYIPGEACTEDSSFVKECIDPDTWCRGNGYNVTSCTLPKYLSGKCPHSSTLYKSCETDNARACRDAGYASNCEVGKIGDRACPYDSKYKTCVCNPCAGFAYTSAQASAQGYVPGEVCNSCGTIKYKRTENACSGFKTCDCGGATGAKTCWSGTVKKFDTCKECCDSSFYKYDSSNCNGGKVLGGYSCGTKYSQCKDYNDPNYEFTCDDEDYVNNNLNRFENAPYLYSDGTVSTQLLSGKTPIAIVISQEERLAIALKGKISAWFGAKEYTAWKNLDKQNKGYSDVARDYFSYTDVPTLSVCKPYSYQGGDKCDPDGFENTQKLIKFADETGLELPAVEYVRNYSPDNITTPAQWFAKGKWFLPSLRQMYLILDKKNVLGNYVARRKIDNTAVAHYVSLCSMTYWTSNRGESSITWFVGSNTGNYWGYYKPIEVGALPMLHY